MGLLVLLLDWMYINPFAIYIVFFIYELCYVNQKLELTIVDKAGGFAMFTGW